MTASVGLNTSSFFNSCISGLPEGLTGVTAKLAALKPLAAQAAATVASYPVTATFTAATVVYNLPKYTLRTTAAAVAAYSVGAFAHQLYMGATATQVLSGMATHAVSIITTGAALAGAHPYLTAILALAVILRQPQSPARLIAEQVVVLTVILIATSNLIATHGGFVFGFAGGLAVGAIGGAIAGLKYAETVMAERAARAATAAADADDVERESSAGESDHLVAVLDDEGEVLDGLSSLFDGVPEPVEGADERELARQEAEKFAGVEPLLSDISSAQQEGSAA